MRGKVVLFLLLAAAKLCSSEPLLQPVAETKVLPDDDGQLNPFTFLMCMFEPPSEIAQAQWVLPNGDIISESTESERFVVGTGADNETSLETMLMISKLSYEDAGVYTCQAKHSTAPESHWLSATIELQLKVIVQALESRMAVYDNDTMVKLSCEMIYFIREDEDLQWFVEGQQIISGTSNRTITYADGTTPHTAQNGGDSLISSRVSVLTISDPREADTGTYTCRLQNTRQSADIHLTVQPISTVGDETSRSDQADSSDGGGNTLVLGVVLGVVGAIVLLTALVVAIVCVVFWKRRYGIATITVTHAEANGPSNNPTDRELGLYTYVTFVSNEEKSKGTNGTHEYAYPTATTSLEPAMELNPSYGCKNDVRPTN